MLTYIRIALLCVLVLLFLLAHPAQTGDDEKAGLDVPGGQGAWSPDAGHAWWCQFWCSIHGSGGQLSFSDSSYRLSKEAGWSALFSNILHNYQYWFILLIIIIVTALTVLFAYHAIFGPKYKMAAQNTSYMMPPGGSPAAAGLYPPGGSPGLYGSYYAPQTPKSPTLWSQGYMPVDGSSPTRRRSPIQRISPS